MQGEKQLPSGPVLGANTGAGQGVHNPIGDGHAPLLRVCLAHRTRQDNPPGRRLENLSQTQWRKGGKGVPCGDGGQRECYCSRGRAPAPGGHDGAGEKWAAQKDS